MYHFTTGEIQRILRLVQIWPSIVQNRDYFFINCAKPRLHCKAKRGVEKSPLFIFCQQQQNWKKISTMLMHKVLPVAFADIWF